MNLLIVIPYYEPAWAYGGPPRLVSTIARALAHRHQVTVLTTDVYDADRRLPAGYATVGGVTVHRFSTWSNTLAWKTKIILPRQMRAAVEAHVQASDFVFLSDFRHYLNAVVVPALWRLHKPYSLSAYGQIQKPHDGKYPLKVIFDWWRGRRLIQRANILFAQTQHEANDYISLGARREQIILSPLMENAPTPAELAQRGKFRAQFHIPARTKLLLFVGRLHKLKGLDLLLRTFVEVRQRLPHEDIRLVIVGRDDGYQATLNAEIARLRLNEAVIQTGPRYGVENAACYLDADCFVFTPTYYEETSLAAVRALSFGLPVITTPQAELPWLDEYHAGSTVIAQPEVVVTQLTRLLADAKLHHQLRVNATRLFNDHYRTDQVITALEHAIIDHL